METPPANMDGYVIANRNLTSHIIVQHAKKQ